MFLLSRPLYFMFSSLKDPDLSSLSVNWEFVRNKAPPSPTDSESAFQQDPQVIVTYSKV